MTSAATELLFRLRDRVEVLEATLRVIASTPVQDERFDLYAGWVRDVAATVLADGCLEDAVGNADALAQADD